MAAAAAAFVLVACFLAVAIYGLQRPVSFDGAMNLQVADALADGEGYIRNYNGPRAFPREVQTNAPFVVPAAIVFELFGIGLVQSQIVNLLYMAGFLSLLVVFIGRLVGYVPGLLAAAACLLIPDFSHIGMNGWGEIVALFWWWLGSYLLLSPADPDSARRRLLGAACLGMALATKTVLLIGVAATAGTYMLWQLVERDQAPWRARLLHGVFPLLAIAAPLAVVETWRLMALGGSSYLAWWGDQLAAITWQTGVKATVNTEMSLWDKASGHMQALVRQLGQPLGLVLPWLFVPVLGSFAAIRSPARLRRPAVRVWLAVLMMATVYLIWWLVITPNSHARLRRIMIGLVAVQLLWVFLSAWVAARLSGRNAGGKHRPFAALACYAPLLLINLAFLWTFIGTMKANFGADMRPFHEAVAFVKRLPADAPLFGKGFLSSPVTSLYADREFLDIDQFPVTELHDMGSGYLMADSPAVHARRFRPELRRYHTELVLDQAGQRVYFIDFTRYRDPFPRRARADVDDSYVDFTENGYKHVYGVHGSERGGWRWATSDAEILLRYEGQQFVQFEIFKPRKIYARPGPLSLHISIDGCEIGTVQVAGKGKRLLTVPLTENCTPTVGSVVRLGIMADNLMPLVPNNLRELSYVLLAAGFKDKEDLNAAPAPPAPRR